MKPYITEHPEDDRALHIRAGDVILTGRKAQGIISKAIKLGSKLRGADGLADRFSHSALVTTSDGEICEAQEKGVVFAHISKYDKDDYIVIHTGCEPWDQLQIIDYAESVVAHRTGYGFLTFAGLALYCLTGASLVVGQAGTAICSGFVCDALTRAGVIWPRPPFSMMPFQIYQHYATAKIRDDGGPTDD